MESQKDISPISMIDYICVLCSKRQLTEFCIASSEDINYKRLIYDYHTENKDISVHVLKCNYCNLIQLIPQTDITEFFKNDMQTKSLIHENIDYDMLYPKYIDDTQRKFKLIDNLLNKRSLIPSAYIKKREIKSDDIDSSDRYILDIGCGYGFVVDMLVKNNYNVTGIDCSPSRIQFADENMEGEFICDDATIIENEDFLVANKGKYDLITLFHSFQQIKHFKEFIQRLFPLLKENGSIMIEVQNSDDENIHHIESYKHFYYQIPNCVYYNKTSLTYLMKGLNITDYTILPIQRYGLENLFNWVNNNEPQLYKPSYITTNPIYKPIERYYKKNKEKTYSCDTLLVVINNIN
jgi:2-polyprenyl-3-methyl-5-hydroxy-6-metoxy-1,4-benzoquinol methylase